jgi:hypothetical protein
MISIRPNQSMEEGKRRVAHTQALSLPHMEPTVTEKLDNAVEKPLRVQLHRSNVASSPEGIKNGKYSR